jgi:hypothetical protein
VLALPLSQVDTLIDRCWQIDGLRDIGELVSLAVPLTESVR